MHRYLKHGNLVLRMRFPYLELEGHAEKYIERKATATTPPIVAKAVPIAVEEPEPVIQRAPAKKPPKAAKEQEQQPAQVNEQHPYFE